VTLSPCLTINWAGANANDLKSQAPTLFGSVILNPHPVGIVEFTGILSAGCSEVFWLQVSQNLAAFKFVIPS
jgi:hypothetical protein